MGGHFKEKNRAYPHKVPASAQFRNPQLRTNCVYCLQALQRLSAWNMYLVHQKQFNVNYLSQKILKNKQKHAFLGISITIYNTESDHF